MSKRVDISRASAANEGGVPIQRALPSAEFDSIGPFVFLDHMGPIDLPPRGPRGSPPHPHCGIETVSYVLEGAVEHRDSAGGHGIVRSGGMQWMTAGRGVVHSELAPAEEWAKGQPLHALQLWVNLPAAKKGIAPAYTQREAAEIPSKAVEGGQLRVLAGQIDGLDAGLHTHVPVTLAHATLRKSHRFHLQPIAGHEIGIYCLTGCLCLGSNELTSGDIVRLSPEGEIELDALQDTDFVILGGKAIDEPVVASGPFVMNSMDQIQQAYSDFRAGKFGAI